MKTLFSSKRHHYLARASIFLIMVALIAGMVGCGGGGGPAIEIRTWYDLDAIRNSLASNYILMNDLDSTTAGYEELASPTANGGKGWQPIGTSDPLFVGLEGTFDGQGHEIKDLFIDRPDESDVGIFSFVDERGVVQNVGVVNATVTGRDRVGGLVGFNEGSVSNSYFSGSLTGDQIVGGLVGESSYGTVSNSYFTGNMTGNANVGGLVGFQAYGSVNNSYADGNVTGDFVVGGLVGDNGYGSVSNSHFSGSLTGDQIVGGLVGVNIRGNVNNSHYSYDEVLINAENIISIGALFSEDFDQWLANDKFLDVNERLSPENGYYVVNNVSDFKELLAFGQNSSLKFRLKNDLDLATEPNFYIPYLAGEFDGNGHRILDLSFDLDFVLPVGLFGYLAPGGKITQLSVENVSIVCASLGGGLVGFSHGTVSNSYSSGNITGGSSVGGLVGGNHYGTVSNSYSMGSVTGDRYVGGLVGDSHYGNVSNSSATGSVTGYDFVGGLVGENSYGTVSNSYATGSVTGYDFVGGLVGVNTGTVSNSFWDTQTSGQTTSAGGTGKTTTEMQDITTFSGATWYITAVANPGTRNPSYIWNIVDDQTYPFLSWQPA